MHTNLLKLRDVSTKEEARFYLGKRVAYVYHVKANTAKAGKAGKVKRVIWGRVTRPHGANGVVRAKFDKNLPCTSIAKKCRVMLFPSNI
jgi:large subunit ribosomal protein L35Ae